MSIIEFLRSFRIYNIALFDLFISLVGLYIFGKTVFPGKPPRVYLLWSVIFVLPIGIMVHYLFGIPTMLNFYLGISTRPQ